jgi:hypothetical protein
MKAYELLARIRCLSMTDLDGEIAWIGTREQRARIPEEEERIIAAYELAQTGI